VIRPRTVLATFGLIVALPAVAAGCGGGGDGEDDDPREVIERTFGNEEHVSSGVMELALNASASGEQGGEFAVDLAGAFEGDPDDPQALPQLDLEGSVSGSGGGESIDESGRVVLTEDNAFVEYGGETYEAGEEMFADFKAGYEEEGSEIADPTSFRESCEQAIEELGGDTSACDIDPAEDWLTNLENEGTEDVEGVETVHVSGDLDVEAVVTDLTGLISSAPGFGLEGFDPAQIAAAVPEAGFDLYSGTDDDEMRRFEMTMTIDPAAATGGIVPVPIEEIGIDFSLTLSELDEEQTIEAPEGPTQPLDELLGGLGIDDLGAGGLGGAGGLPDFGDAQGGADGGDDLGGGGGGAGDPGAEDISPEQAQDYLDCIQEAAGDPEAINACADEI